MNYRKICDPAADVLVEKLYSRYSGKEMGVMYRNLLNEIDELDYHKLPEEMECFFNEHQLIPEWIDFEKIKIAENLFIDIGPEYASSLILRALPVGYSSKNVVKLLAQTGYLSNDIKTGTAKRLLETSQFLFNVMRRNTFVKDAPGMKHILKVRFIHAMVRYHVRKHGWNEMEFGAPINQQDMSLTILTFSVSAIMGLEKFNILLNLEEKNALVHYWAIVGKLIGVKTEINPDNFIKGKVYYDKLLKKEASSCEEGKELTRALANFITATFEFSWLPDITDYMIRYLIGNDYYSNILSLKKPESLKDRISFNSAISILKKLNKHREISIINRIIQPANKFFTNSILQYFDKEFNMKLNIPEELKRGWGL